MPDTKSGLAAAVAELMAATEDMREAEQLALLPTAAARRDAAASDEDAQRSGPGRPRGSKNKSTSEWTAFIQARYTDPRLFLAETYTRPADQLATELGCSVKEAFGFQVQAAKELLPYVAQKQPMAVQVDQRGQVTLIVNRGDTAPAAVAGDGARVIDAEILQAETDEAEAESGATENTDKSDT